MTQVKNAATPVAKVGAENTKTAKPETNETPSIPVLPRKLKQDDEGMNFDDTQHRLNQLWELQGKYNRFQASKLKLKEFTQKNSESETQTLSLSKGYRNEDFSTQNPEIIKEVVKFLQTLIEQKAIELQKQIRW